MMNRINLKQDHIEYLKKIFDSYCPNAEILAYGSRVNGDSHDGSDLDLTVIDFNQHGKSLSELKQLINDSNIPILVDISLFKFLPQSFQNEIMNDYLVFYRQGHIAI